MTEQTEQNAPAVEPVTEAPGTPSTPSAASEAPAAALIATDSAAALVPAVEAAATSIEASAVEEVMTERAKLMRVLHHVVGDVESFGEMIEAHASAAVKAGEHDIHAALSRIAMLFGEFRNGLLSAGKTLPAKLADEAAGLVEKSKG